MNPRRRLILAALAADGAGGSFAPAAILIEGERIIVAGRPEEIGAVESAELIDSRDHVVIPALVNAHAHLDLTHIGPRPFKGDFPAWLADVRSRRAATPDAIRESVQAGIELSRRGGVALVGDIAGGGALIPAETMRANGLPCVSYLEFFGLGARQAGTVAAIQTIVDNLTPGFGLRAGGVRVGLQPHAPFSCGEEVYRAAAAHRALPLATHLAETVDELECVRAGKGPLTEMLRAIGVWDDTIAPAGRHPIDYVLEAWAGRPFIAAHVNYVDDVHIHDLADARASVVYCPRASAYFGHPPPNQPPHRYRDMLAAGVNVALGTDSIINLDTPDRISVLDEMRLLHRRDGTGPLTLLRMATVNGATALGFREELFSLAPGPTAGLLALPLTGRTGVNLLGDALAGDSAPEWIVGPVAGASDWIAAVPSATIRTS